MATDDLEYSFDRRGDAARLAASGDIDVVTVGAFEQALRAALLGTGSRLEVDLSEVDYLGSEGIRALIIAHRVAADAGVTVRVVPSPIVHRAIEVAGLQCWLDT